MRIPFGSYYFRRYYEPMCVMNDTFHAHIHWVCGLVHRQEFYTTRKHTVSEIGSVYVFRLTEGDTYSVGSSN
jgi:hypothetical protein